MTTNDTIDVAEHPDERDPEISYLRAPPDGKFLPLETKDIGGPDDYGSLVRRFEIALGKKPTTDPGLTKLGYAFYGICGHLLLSENYSLLIEYEDEFAGFLAAARGEQIPTVSSAIRSKVFSRELLKDLFRGKMHVVFADTRNKITKMQRGVELFHSSSTIAAQQM